MRCNVDPEQKNPSVPPPATPPSDPSLQATDSSGVAGDGERTVEQADAEWKFRLSQKDRAHAAAETVLQEQIATLERKLAGRASDQSGQAPSAEPEELTQLRRELETEKTQRVVAERKAKFPALAAFLGNDAGTLFSASEVELAKLNAGLEQTGGTLIAPTAPRRGAPAAAKPLGDKSKEELLDDLKRLAPAYEQWTRDQT